MNKTEIQEMIHKIIDSLQNLKGTVVEKDKCYDVSMNDWSWPQGVALFAMYQYYRIQGDSELLTYLEAWFDNHIRKGFPPKDVNNMCPMLTMAYLYEEGRKDYLPYLEEWCDFAVHSFPRTEEGGYTHYIHFLPNEGQLWDDTLYMTVLFLAKMGQLKGDKSLKEESVRQFLVHIKYLTDTKTGLFFHGWNFHGRHHFGNALWARGNSWYTAGLVDYLTMIELEPGVQQFLCSTLDQQVRALKKYQDETGLWHTIIDHKETYLETSGSSAFAYGILKAVRTGKLDPEYRSVGLKAAEGVCRMIDQSGTVQGVSAGTPVFSSIEEYNEVDVRPMPYGQSMALLMLTELMRQELEKHGSYDTPKL